MGKLFKYILIPFSVFYIFGSCTPEVRFSTYTSTNLETNAKISYSKSNIEKQKSIRKILKEEKYSKIDNKRKEILILASKWIGTPYCYGGTSSRCIDCSGFTQQVFNSAGIKIPRTAKQQYRFGEKVNNKRILPGDLVFFYRHNRIGHVGIYIGDNTFIHASTSRGVTKQSLSNSYYKRTFAGYKKIL